MRTIIKIDEEACDGCGICVDACHEGAIGLINGKAVLLHEHYCDGLGDCLPACPQNAISFEEREAAAYDEAAVLAAQRAKAEATAVATAEKPAMPCGCPGSMAKLFAEEPAPAKSQAEPEPSQERASQLRQWPVQIKLISPDAPYFADADLLIAADCAAFAYAGFHEDFMTGKITIIGCPKLDSVDYTEKLAYILSTHNVASVTVARMQVPCCGGIEHATRNALAASGKDIPLTVATFTTDGHLLSQTN